MILFMLILILFFEFIYAGIWELIGTFGEDENRHTPYQERSTTASGCSD